MLQTFLDQYDIIALSETKWDVPTVDILPGFKHFVMPKKGLSHRHGGIHGLCVFVRKHLVITFMLLTIHYQIQYSGRKLIKKLFV